MFPLTVFSVGRGIMENTVVELIAPVHLEKQGCAPIDFNPGTLFRVILEYRESFLVKADSGFTFILHTHQENKIWKKFAC